ncbi:L-fuculose-phosphate aldolase, partial [Blastomyces silverae]
MSPTAVTEITVPVNNPIAKSKEDQQKTEPQHVHGGEGLTALQAISHGGIALPGIPSFTSHELKRQWQLEHMAGAFRIWARHGYTEGMSGHISVRDPEHANAFWTNPLAVHFGMLKASDMIL